MPQEEQDIPGDVRKLKKSIYDLIGNVSDTLLAKSLYIKESVEILDAERLMQKEFLAEMGESLSMVGFSNEEYVNAIQ